MSYGKTQRVRNWTLDKHRLIEAWADSTSVQMSNVELRPQNGCWETNPENLADFAKRLTQRIEATLGHGKHIPELAIKDKRS